MTELADKQSKMIFPETVDGDIDEHIHSILQNFFNIDNETVTILGSYISGIVEDAGNDPFEAGESIEVLLRDSIDDNKLEGHISKFTNQLVQHQIKKNEAHLLTQQTKKEQRVAAIDLTNQIHVTRICWTISCHTTVIQTSMAIAYFYKRTKHRTHVFEEKENTVRRGARKKKLTADLPLSVLPLQVVRL